MNQVQTEDTEISKDENIEPELSQLSIHESIDSLSKRIIDDFFSDDRFKDVLKDLADIKKEKSYKLSRPRSKKSSKVTFTKMSHLVKWDRDNFRLEKNVQFAKNYLETVLLVYEELESELGNEFYLGDSADINKCSSLDVMLSKNGTFSLELLYRIERFVLSVGYGFSPAYIPEEINSYFEVKDQGAIKLEKKRITALGYELLFLLNHKDEIENMADSLYLSSNAKIFSEFLRSYFRRPSNKKIRIIDFMDQDISSDSFFELNSILNALRCTLNKVGFERVSGLRRGKVYMREYTLEKEKLNIKEVSKKLDKRLRSSIDYFRNYKDRNIILYRFRIWLNDESDKDISLEKFKVFFTELNKKAAKPEAGFKGYLNFFYYWDIDNGEWFQDIVILIDVNTLLIDTANGSNNLVRDIREEFNEYALEILNHRGRAIFENEELPSLFIESVPVLYSLDLPSSFIIECGDKENWKIFEEKILPYYCYHEILEIADSDVTDRFSRGRR